MKKLPIIAILISVMSANASGLNTVKDIIIDSQVYYYFGTSKMKSITEYEDNLPKKTVGYYKTGRKSYLKTFSGTNIVNSKTWFDSGYLRSETIYSAGVILQEKMYFRTGLLDYIAYYTAGVMTKEETYFDKKTIESEVFYKDNNVESEKRYYKSGSIKQITRRNKDNLMERVSYGIRGNVQSTFLLPTPFPIDQLDSIVDRNGNLVTFYESGGIESITKLIYSETTEKQPEDEYFKKTLEEVVEEVNIPTSNYLEVDPLRPTIIPESTDLGPKQKAKDTPMLGLYNIKPKQLDDLVSAEDSAEAKVSGVKDGPLIEFYSDGSKKSVIEYFHGQPNKKVEYDEYGLIANIYTSYTKEGGWSK